jgi:hypothetical protein
MPAFQRSKPHGSQSSLPRYSKGWPAATFYGCNATGPAGVGARVGVMTALPSGGPSVGVPVGVGVGACGVAVIERAGDSVVAGMVGVTG